jgi:hypothetical protein
VELARICFMDRARLKAIPAVEISPRSSIEAVWSRYFDVIGYVEGAIDGYQDAVLLRKRS